MAKQIPLLRNRKLRNSKKLNNEHTKQETVRKAQEPHHRTKEQEDINKTKTTQATKRKTPKTNTPGNTHIPDTQRAYEFARSLKRAELP